jgi:hypothetical protein
MRNQLTQKVNFYLSVCLISAFGFFTTVTVVQALNADAPLVKHFASPIDLSAVQ